MEGYEFLVDAEVTFSIKNGNTKAIGRWSGENNLRHAVMVKGAHPGAMHDCMFTLNKWKRQRDNQKVSAE